MARRVIELGPVPPPFGGVSLHIVRFMELLRAEGVKVVSIHYAGTTRSGRFMKLLQVVRMVVDVYLRAHSNRDDVIHLHYGGRGYFLALAPLLAFARARKVLTLHSVRVLQDLELRPNWLRTPMLALLNRFDHFVAVRTEIGDGLRQWGLTRQVIGVMPAFLPPAPSERDATRLPTEVVSALRLEQASGRIQICCAAYNLGPGYGRNDVYGVEQLLDALSRCTPISDREFMLWVLVSKRPETEGQRQSEAAISEAAGRLVGVHVHLHYGLPLVPVMARCSAFLRPSLEDGDSVAIREALSLGLPVLASDVVTRPDAVVTYSPGVPGSLESKLGEFLSRLRPLPDGAVHEILPGDIDRYEAFVQEIIGLSAAR